MTVIMLNLKQLVKCNVKHCPRIVHTAHQSSNRTYTNPSNNNGKNPLDDEIHTSDSQHQANSSRRAPFDFKSARARRKLSPALRIASMLPDDFWKEQASVDSVLPVQKPPEQICDQELSENSGVGYTTDFIQSEAYKYGDCLMITLIRDFRQPLKRLFYCLSKKQLRRISTYGNLADDEIVGKKALDKVSTSTGYTVLLSSPTIEDYFDVAPKCTSTLSTKVSMF